MASPIMYMTATGFEKIERSLERLRTKRQDLAEPLAESCAGGDGLDNTEYLVLRSEAAFLEIRILELEEILRHAELIQLGQADGKVHLGNSVAVQADGEPIESFTIVGRAEANPLEGYISNESPLGRALLDHAVGDDILVSAPDGDIKYRIIAVT